MTNSAQLDEKQRKSSKGPITDATACTGTCVYEWDGNQYNWVSGACSGGATCAPCPGSLNGDTRTFVLANPKLFPDADNPSFPCSSFAGDTLDVDAILLARDYVRSLQRERVLEKKVSFYKTVSLGLGILSLLLIAALGFVAFLR